MRKLVMIGALLLSGCAAGPYFYEPAEQATATASGFPAADYELPPEAPRGDVRVATYGITKIVRHGEPPAMALHVRMIVANNNSAGSWTLDTRQARLEIGEPKGLAPTFANTKDGVLPIVEIPAGQKRTVDLYYALPPALRGARDVPRFDLLWKVTTPEREVAERTPFERMTVEPDIVTAYGAGGGWWSDPFYGPYYGVPETVIIERTHPAPPNVYGYPPR